MKTKTEPGVRLRDILPLLGEGPAFLCHAEAEQAVPAEDLRRLTGAGREDYAALLGACVSKLCLCPEGIEVVLTGVPPEELVRFREDCTAFLEAEQAIGPADAPASGTGPPVQYPFLRGSRPLSPGDLEVYERVASYDGRLTFCLDVLADEQSAFGRRLSGEDEDSYVQAYTAYDERTGRVDDTLDIVVRSSGGDEWFSCALPDTVRRTLKEKMDAFCVELYGEHLPEPPEAPRLRMEQTM